MEFIKRIFSLDLRALALFRLALGFLMINSLAEYIGLTIFGSHSFRGNLWVILMAVIAIGFMLFFTLGSRTRICAIFSWIFFVLMQYNNQAFIVVDNLLVSMMVFWTMFLPLNAYYSMDRAYKSNEIMIPKSISSVASFALYLQLLLTVIALYNSAQASDWVFPLSSLIILIAFLPTSFIDKFLDFMTNKTSIKIYYDQGCEFCRKMSLALQTYFLPDESQIFPAQEYASIKADLEKYNSWVVVVGNKRFYKFAALIELCKASIVLFPFAYLLGSCPMFVVIGDKFYDFVANNRSFFGFFVMPFSSRRLSFDLPLVGQLVLILSIAYYIWLNLVVLREML